MTTDLRGSRPPPNRPPEVDRVPRRTRPPARSRDPRPRPLRRADPRRPAVPAGRGGPLVLRRPRRPRAGEGALR
ncbi:MAG: hypothetical protein AVDCRST_MAG54-4397 [uncultured Actinomycetospora sp.]|uniref:Uncharacterized protein n=1 Tax=uncultured Actinomycetospora sp. TaxID=1135996 RepID=A0A6J4JXZ2_9PSEU|nr:MAG: hypothetical protein AVDCRST_MAG54-4397 [uncultured Actinomycetospora sp.]